MYKAAGVTKHYYLIVCNCVFFSLNQDVMRDYVLMAHPDLQNIPFVGQTYQEIRLTEKFAEWMTETDHESCDFTTSNCVIYIQSE